MFYRFCVASCAWLLDNLDVASDVRVKAGRSRTDACDVALGGVHAAVAAIAGLAAAWTAAGSMGLFGHPLRRVLTLALLAAAVLISPLPAKWTKRSLLGAAATAAAVALMTASSLMVVNVAASVLVLAFLASLLSGHDRSVVLCASAAATTLVLYRLAYTTIPIVWTMAEAFSGGAGKVAGFISGRPLNVGATFAGLDFLVVMLALWATWVQQTGWPRRGRALYAPAAIFGGHLCYLIILSYVPDVLAAIPPSDVQQGWSWAGLARKAVPWNLPVLASVIHLSVAACMFRWSALVAPATGGSRRVPNRSFRARRMLWSVVLSAAVLLPLAASLQLSRPDLQGKKIVFHEKGFLNWLKPAHGSYGRLSSGMYGMLPPYLESFGAQVVISPDMSEEDLHDADAAVLIFPDDPWADGQLERIWAFVRRGGSLLVLGEHTTRERDGTSRFNDVLEPTKMRVAFDSATFAVGGWLQSYETIVHPATVGIPDDRNQLGVVIGASVEAGRRARPIIVGRWGWSDIGDEGSSRAMMGNDLYDPGERLGDILLAAEQPFGKGKIVVFGDTSSLTNGINVSSHVFTSRLFTYLAGGSARALARGRAALSMLLAVVIVVLLIRYLSAGVVTMVALCLSGSFAVSVAMTSRAWLVLPDGRRQSPNNLAYIDACHLEAHSGESWRGDGVGGLVLTLMRNGYITLSLPRVDSESLGRAGLLISIAPRRSFSHAERAAISEFVTQGGNLIIIAGYDDAGPSRDLLSDFGFAIAADQHDGREPVPMGHFKSPYLRSQEERVYVRFHAAWPVTCDDPAAQVIAYGKDTLPVIILRRVGAGKVVVIGDTNFAANDNLELEDGQPFEGLRENADFWRWFITLLRDEPPWIPPALQGAGQGQELPASPAEPAQEGTP